MWTFGWRGSCCVSNSPTKGGTRVTGRIVSREQLKPHPTRGLGSFLGGSRGAVSPTAPQQNGGHEWRGRCDQHRRLKPHPTRGLGFFCGGEPLCPQHPRHKQGRHGRAALSHAGDQNPTLPVGFFARGKKLLCPQQPHYKREGVAVGGRAAPAVGPRRGPGRGPRGHPAEPVLQLPAGPGCGRGRAEPTLLCRAGSCPSRVTAQPQDPPAFPLRWPWTHAGSAGGALGGGHLPQVGSSGTTWLLPAPHGPCQPCAPLPAPQTPFPALCPL